MSDKEYEFERLLYAAEQAGFKAGQECTPTPMRLQGYAPINNGVCGFAWINLKINNPIGRFIGDNLCKTDQFARYRGWERNVVSSGLKRWVHEFSQSMEKKTAYAKAYSNVLRDAGFNATHSSKID